MVESQAVQLQERCVTELKAEQALANAKLSDIRSLSVPFGSRDIATDYALGQQLAGKLRRVERALQRAREGAYGHCEDCDQPIWERLLALPHAERCVECQMRKERSPFRPVRTKQLFPKAA